MVSGPAAALAVLDSVRLLPVSLAGRRDTVTLAVAPQTLPDWCSIVPDHVEVWIPLEPGVTRRFTVNVRPAGERTDLAFEPARVTAIITTPRRLMDRAFADIQATWQVPGPIADGGARRAAAGSNPLKRGGALRPVPSSFGAPGS